MMMYTHQNATGHPNRDIHGGDVYSDKIVEIEKFHFIYCFKISSVGFK